MTVRMKVAGRERHLNVVDPLSRVTCSTDNREVNVTCYVSQHGGGSVAIVHLLVANVWKLPICINAAILSVFCRWQSLNVESLSRWLLWLKDSPKAATYNLIPTHGLIVSIWDRYVTRSTREWRQFLFTPWYFLSKLFKPTRLPFGDSKFEIKIASQNPKTLCSAR